MFLDTSIGIHKYEVVELYTNLVVLEDSIVTSSVRGVELVYDYVMLGEILNVPIVGLAEYVWKKDENCYCETKESSEG